MGKHKMMVWRKDAQPKLETGEEEKKAPEIPAKNIPLKKAAKTVSLAPEIKPNARQKLASPVVEAKSKAAPAAKKTPAGKNTPVEKTPAAKSELAEKKMPAAKSTPVEIVTLDLAGLFVPPSGNVETSDVPQIPAPMESSQTIQEAPSSPQVEETPAIQTSLASIAADRPAAVLEAALFMSGQALSTMDLAKLVGLAAVGRVEEMLVQLSRSYEQQGSALEVVQEAPGKWVMRVRARLAPAVRGLAGEAEIPKHALRTLAYISKNEGVKKRDLFRRLGSTIYDDVAVLIEKGFVSSTPAGRTVSLRTTAKFRQYFEG